MARLILELQALNLLVALLGCLPKKVITQTNSSTAIEEKGEEIVVCAST